MESIKMIIVKPNFWIRKISIGLSKNHCYQGWLDLTIIPIFKSGRINKKQ